LKYSAVFIEVNVLKLFFPVAESGYYD